MAHMPGISCGLLMYRVLLDGGPEFLLVHPGGPFWKNKDVGAWSIPKGEPAEGEDLLLAARREFLEEIGVAANGEFRALAPVVQKGGKVVHAWLIEGDVDVAAAKSNMFSMEWPPKSGQMAEFPEVDRAGFFDLETAREKINAGQVGLLVAAARMIGGG